MDSLPFDRFRIPFFGTFAAGVWSVADVVSARKMTPGDGLPLASGSSISSATGGPFCGRALRDAGDREEEEKRVVVGGVGSPAGKGGW